MALFSQKNKLFNSFSSLNGKIGILGGTFDPVHNGHLQIAHFAQQKEGLDTVLFIPNKMNPLKKAQPSVSDASRLEMLLLAVEDQDAFFVSDMELQKELPSYTADTLRTLRGLVPPASPLFFIIGADSLPALHLWRNYEEIFSLASIVTVARRDFPFEQLGNLRQNMPEKYLAHLEEHFVHSDYVDISASELRERLQHADIPNDLIPEKVLTYIRKEDLYL